MCGCGLNDYRPPPPPEPPRRRPLPGEAPDDEDEGEGAEDEAEEGVVVTRLPSRISSLCGLWSTSLCVRLCRAKSWILIR